MELGPPSWRTLVVFLVQGSTARNLVELVWFVLSCSLLFLCNCARGFYCSGYALNFWGML